MDITKYMKHLSTCNMSQDWIEAQTAFADTPSHLRDIAWNQARKEMNIQMNTCTCGLEKAIEEANKLQYEK